MAINRTSLYNSSAPALPELEYTLPHFIAETLLALYSTVSVISLLANFIIIFFTLRDRSSMRMSDYFLLCISLSDVLFILLCVPFTVMSNLINFQWLFGQVMCKVVGYIQTVSVTLRSLMLVASAAVQYKGFRRPFSEQLSTKHVFVICLVVWILSLLIPVPIATMSDVVTIGAGEEAFMLCLEIWPNNTVRHVYSVTLMAVTYLLPLLVLLVTKLHISLIVSAKPPGELSTPSLSHRRTRIRRVR